MFGCFADIHQQDGTPVRMHYDERHFHIVKWIGINEQMQEKFRHEVGTRPSTRQIQQAENHS